MATLEELKKEYSELADKLAEPGKFPGEEFANLSKRYAELQETMDLSKEVEKLNEQISELEQELKSPDPEMRELAESELPGLRTMQKEANKRLHENLFPPDPHAAGNAILEIRAGTGGDEAALFARDLFGMYIKYAESQGWKIKIVSESRNDLDGIKEVVAEVVGRGAFGALRFESGVHRVQRIPTTEKSGRIHTSAASVVVLPIAKPEDVTISPSDIKIDTFRASGHGGQKVQKTESAVRITYLPTGLIVSCQDERSQHANKERAMDVLRSRLLDAQLQAQEREQRESRRQQIGTGDRSEKIRTYNFPQDRITDHRIKKSWHGIEGIMMGNLDSIVSTLQATHEGEVRT